jgi:hypothetical protein
MPEGGTGGGPDAGWMATEIASALPPTVHVH